MAADQNAVEPAVSRRCVTTWKNTADVRELHQGDLVTWYPRAQATVRQRAAAEVPRADIRRVSLRRARSLNAICDTRYSHLSLSFEDEMLRLTSAVC